MAAAALEHLHAGAAAAAGLQVQAQRGRRGFVPRLHRAIQEGQLAVFLRSQLQTSQRGEADPFRPGQYGPAASAAQSLLAGPQGCPAAAAADQQQALRGQATRVQEGRTGNPRRIHQHHPLALPGDIRENRQQQAELAEPRLP